MKKILIRVEKIDFFVFLFLLVLLLACVFSEGNRAADAIVGIVFALFLVSGGVMILLALVFLVWMLVERSYLAYLKKAWKNSVSYAVIILVYEMVMFIAHGQRVDILRGAVVTALLALLNPVFDYIVHNGK